MEKKYYFVFPDCFHHGWWIKGTYQEVLAAGVRHLQEEGIKKTDFPLNWDDVVSHYDDNGKEVIDQITHQVRNSYKELLVIEEVTPQDFLESIDLETFEQKGEKWCLEHMDDWFEIV